MSTPNPPPVTHTVLPSPDITSSGQPVAVTVQLPPERHDYVGDLVSGGIGLLGALVGAWAAAKWGKKAALEARALDRKERDAIALEALGLKVGKIYSALMSFRDSYEEAQERLNRGRLQANTNPTPGRVYASHLALQMQALANIPDRVTFLTEELSCVGRKVGYKAVNALVVLDDRYNATLQLQSLYLERRTAFIASVSADGDFEGMELAHHWSEAEYRKYRVDLAVLDSLALAIGNHSTEDLQSAFEALKDITQAQVDDHPERGGAELTMPDRQKIEIRPTVKTPKP